MPGAATVAPSASGWAASCTETAASVRGDAWLFGGGRAGGASGGDQADQSALAHVVRCRCLRLLPPEHHKRARGVRGWCGDTGLGTLSIGGRGGLGTVF